MLPPSSLCGLSGRMRIDTPTRPPRRAYTTLSPMPKLFCLLALLAAAASAQSVEGTVLDAATGKGINGVKVELLRGTTPFYETSTDGGGAFRFDNLRATGYAIRYQSPDYWLTAGPSDYKTFPVAEGATVKLEARLMPWSKIAGRVLDARGNAIANARIELSGAGMVANGRVYMRTSWGGGGGGQLSAHSMPLTFRGVTDARGNFDVQLMPGAYALSVLPPTGLKPPAPEPGGLALAWTRTYYPGATAPESALNIVALPGSEIASVDVVLQAVPAHSVRGVVLSPDGAPAPAATIMLGDSPVFATTESNPDGTFEFAAVAEGEWRLTANTTRGAANLRATEWIDVARRDLEDLKLRLVPPLHVQGKVVVEAAALNQAAPLRPTPFSLTLHSGRTRTTDEPGMRGALVNPNADGDFLVEALFPGTYGLGPMLQPPAPPYYLDSIRIGAADRRLQDVEIASDTSITVLYKTDGGSVTGNAENCASGGVLLLPADPALRRPGFSSSAPCDESGRYEARAVRPGDYLALAIAGNGPVPALAGADAPLLKQAAHVTVRSGEATLLDLRAATKPLYELRPPPAK